MSNNSRMIPYFIAGAGLGAIVALLFAPKSGRELRGDITETTRRSLDSATHSVQELGRKAGDLYADGREKAFDIVESGKSLLTDQSHRVASALEAGKNAYQDR